jgi:hypothetical protein
MNIVLAFVLVCLAGCSHRTSQSVDLSQATKRDIKVKSASEARHIIQNHERYLSELFRQSRDPYYNKNKWSDECLRDNVVGKTHEFEGRPLSISILYLDQSLQPGACFGERFHVIMIYCPELGAVREIKINLADKLKAVNERSLCL